MKSCVILIGGGGHAKSVIDALNNNASVEIIGILDAKDKMGQVINGIDIVGSDKDLEHFYEQGVKQAFISIGSVGSPIARVKIYEKLKKIGYSLVNIIDSTAVLSNNIILGEGNYIGKGVIINTGTSIGNNCIINTGCIIEHECIIDDFVHIGPGAVLCGGVEINTQTHIGAGSVIIQYRKVGSSSIIGAGSIVVNDIGANKKAYGNPCREVDQFE